MTKGLQHADAFVIQFRATKAGADQFPGRIEHVASGHTATFESVEELPQLLLRMLNNTAFGGNDRSRMSLGAKPSDAKNKGERNEEQ